MGRHHSPSISYNQFRSLSQVPAGQSEHGDVRGSTCGLRLKPIEELFGLKHKLAPNPKGSGFYSRQKHLACEASNAAEKQAAVDQNLPMMIRMPEAMAPRVQPKITLLVWCSVVAAIPEEWLWLHPLAARATPGI